MEYNDFLKRKKIIDSPTGLASIPDLNPMLFDFQRDIVRWALRRGRAAIFADCGMGKTAMQLEWAQHVPGGVLIVAPLAVAEQTIREARKFHEEEIFYSADGCTDGHRVVITNYERLHHFDPGCFNGIVLDESSILKSYTGKYRTDLIERFGDIPFRLLGSEGYESMRLGRRFIGIELKPSYYEQAVKNLREVEKSLSIGVLDFGHEEISNA